MIFDGLVLGVIAFFVVFGFMRGFLRSLTGILGWVLAAVGSLLVLPSLQPLLEHYVGNSLWAFIGLACAVFFIFLLLTFFISDWLVHWVRMSPLKPVDSVLGTLFAFVKAMLLLSVTYWAFIHFYKSDDLPPWLEESYARPYLEDSVEFMKKTISDITHDESASVFFKRQFGFLEKLLEKQDTNVVAEQGMHSLEHVHKPDDA